MSFVLTVVMPSDRASESFRRSPAPHDMRFRYGYICRLIDDEELRALPDALRARTRAAHKEMYWKSLSLLRRDARFVLKVRREKMAACQQWDFQSLLNQYTQMQTLLLKLTVAGMTHSVHLGAGLESARQACLALEGFLTPASSPLALTA